MRNLERLDRAELKEMLLACGEHRVDERFFEHPELHPAVELRDYFDRASAGERARLKDAIYGAAAEWRGRAHGMGSLRFLAHAASLLRVREAAPHFERALKRAQGFRTVPGEHGAEDVAGDLAATLAGFAPGEDIATVLERVFFAAGLRPHLAGVLLQGLCRCRPDSFSDYLARYLEIVHGSAEQHFDRPIFLRLFVESVTPRILSQTWPSLPSDSRAFLLDHFGNLQSLSLYYVLDPEGPALYDSAGGRPVRFGLRGETRRQRFDDAQRSYRTQAEHVDVLDMLNRL